jgi:succinylarginine dihydrolase
MAREFNFDGLVGPSHNYAGLSFGNVASFSNVKSASNPRQAALQGLDKMRARISACCAPSALAAPMPTCWRAHGARPR